jgi:ABC-type dipeptide/oligopeptide/nickel transport system permease subunit
MSMSKKHSLFQSEKVQVFFGRGAIVWIALVIILVFNLAAIFASQLTHYDPNENNLPEMLLNPSLAHPLGTDLYGRDVFTRLLFGARVSITASFCSCAFAAVFGMLLGLLAGYYQKAVSRIILRYVDLQLSIPPLLFTLILGLVFGHGMFGLIVALGFGMIPSFVRLMYSTVITLKESDFITALKLGNISNAAIIFRHLLPNTFAPMITMFAMNMGGAILLESTISYLNLGIQQPAASWGNMVSDGQQYLLSHPSLCIVPGICVMLLTIAFNILGDSFADAFDPKLRGKL